MELSTHKRQAAVVADRDLGLVRVDEDARMASRPAAAVAGHDAVVRPADRLLVDELYGGVGLGLQSCRKTCISSARLCLSNHIYTYLLSSFNPTHLVGDDACMSEGQYDGAVKQNKRTCRSKSVCSNRGPVMASLRGRWLRDQISFRLGACGSSAGTWVCVLGTGDSVDTAGATALSSSLRAVVVNVRRAMADSPRADRR